MEKKFARKQTVGEEIANTLSHGIGALLAAIGAVLLVGRGWMTGSGKITASLMAYGISLVLLYTASAAYHAVRNEKWKARLRILDHCSIYLLILGTYIPMSLLVIGGKLGWLLCLTNATLTILGITLTAIDLKRFDKLSLILYALMGWLAVVAMRTILSVMSPLGTSLLIGGGLAYTVGIVFYRSKRSFMHFVWHLFVLLGSVLQYLCILVSCL